jgi:serine/threonine protein kinase
MAGTRGDIFAPPAGAETDEPGLLAGRYRLIRRLGAGGMARVDLAEDVHLQREVAVKRLHSGRAEEDARRFAREAHLGATLNHPNVVTVFDALSDADTVLIVMEYVEGTDLEAVLRSGPPSGEEALRILDGLAAAIDHAHEEGIVHRDVKPSNVLIRKDGVVKLADLGIARALEDTAITRSGIVLGSLPYIAPEALQGGETGPAADVYSVGLIAYEALTGTKARREGTVPEVTHRAVNEPPPDLRAARSDLPQAAADVVARALDPDPARRPFSAGAFVRDLREALSKQERTASETVPIPVAEPLAAEPKTGELKAGEPSTPPPKTWEPPSAPAERDRRNRWILPLIGTALAVGAIVVFAVLMLGGGSGGSKASSARAQSSNDTKGATAGRGAGAGPSAAADSNTPDGAVQSFYERAASGDYHGAWELADSSFRSQLGGFPAFESQQSTLRSIEFPSLDVTSESGSSATVSFSTVATHTSFVDRCTGSMTLAKADAGWVIDQAQDISCDRSSQ